MPIIDFPWSVHLRRIWPLGTERRWNSNGNRAISTTDFQNWIFSDPRFKCLLLIAFTMIKLKKLINHVYIFT